MFDVLAFVYHSYVQHGSCPEAAQLGRKLHTIGFDGEEIADALGWLHDLDHAARQSLGFAALPLRCGAARAPQPLLSQPQPTSTRIYPRKEQQHLGVQAMAFVRFLESAAVLPAHMREVIVDRAMAAPGAPVALEDLKLIVLMVYWSFGQKPDALVLDELCETNPQRRGH